MKRPFVFLVASKGEELHFPSLNTAAAVFGGKLSESGGSKQQTTRVISDVDKKSHYKWFSELGKLRRDLTTSAKGLSEQRRNMAGTMLRLLEQQTRLGFMGYGLESVNAPSLGACGENKCQRGS